ncbi:FRAS1-related extracellular matrix protein 1-like isoform 2-T3 [Salvelinus alpinus]
MAVTPDALVLSDSDTPSRDLLFWGGVPFTAGSNFTQWDLLEVTYRHGGGPSQMGRIAFTASHTTNRGLLLEGRVQTEPVYFTIQMDPLGSSDPEVVQLLSLWKADVLSDGRYDGRYGIYLSSRDAESAGRLHQG